MITLHFHLQPQYKYELFHINFTSFYCTGRYELNKLTSLPMCGFIAQLVEHRTGIAEVTGSNPIEALIFSGFFFPIAQLNWKIYCNDHSSLSSTTAVRIWTISNKLHTLHLCNKRVLYLSRITWRSLTLFPMMINRPSSAYQQTLSVRRRESSAHRWVSRTTNDVVLHCAVVLYVIC